MSKRKSLEETLLEQGLLSEAQIKEVREESKKSREPVRKVLIRLGMVAEEDVIALIGEELGIPSVDLSSYLIDPKTISLIPESLAKRHSLIPLFKTGDTLTVAMADPLNVVAIDEARLKTKLIIEPAVATESNIKQAISQYYGVEAGTIDDLAKSIDSEAITALKEGGEEIELKKLQAVIEEAPVIRLVNLIIMQAIQDNASDVHIEPEDDFVRVRYRIDGVLHEVSHLPKRLQAAVTSRIKIMADLNIAKKRIPQDGRFQINVENSQIDLRTSTLPTIYGENVVMRILDSTGVLLGLEQLGFAPEDLKKIQDIIVKPYGIILVTGPTGSGKTTTLYGALSTINSPEKNIVTLEDPVEYRLSLIRQSQINPKAGLTFASGLRSILRQDPNIVMVGEIRDLETAEIAIQAALTGHLVFSTLHTNDAPSAATRLIDMGVEPFLISSSVEGIIAQRLVRKICPDCREPYKPTEKLLRDLALPDSKYTFYRGKGCPTCKDTGYKGRTGIYEVLTFNDKIRELVLGKASSSDIKKAAQEAGVKFLREDGIQKVIKGITSVDEVLRVTLS